MVFLAANSIQNCLAARGPNTIAGWWGKKSENAIGLVLSRIRSQASVNQYVSFSLAAVEYGRWGEVGEILANHGQLLLHQFVLK